MELNYKQMMGLWQWTTAGQAECITSLLCAWILSRAPLNRFLYLLPISSWAEKQSENEPGARSENVQK